MIGPRRVDFKLQCSPTVTFSIVLLLLNACFLTVLSLYIFVNVGFSALIVGITVPTVVIISIIVAVCIYWHRCRYDFII